MNFLFVTDASATLSWCFPDEATPATENLLHQLRMNAQAVVPPHWPVEVGNSLLVGVRRQRVDLGTVERFIRDLESLSIFIDSAPPWSTFFSTLALA